MDDAETVFEPARYKGNSFGTHTHKGNKVCCSIIMNRTVCVVCVCHCVFRTSGVCAHVCVCVVWGEKGSLLHDYFYIGNTGSVHMSV